MVLKATVPGVPDFYQGTEMWDLSLVDPDNRRPVDYALRTDALAGMLAGAEKKGEASVAAATLGTLEDGRIKLWAMHRVLSLRNEHLAVFEQGSYTPLTATPAEKEEHVFAFLRGEDVLVVLPRFSYTLGGGEGLALGKAWDGVALTLPEGSAADWTNIFTGETSTATAGILAIDEAFKSFPVAVFVRKR